MQANEQIIEAVKRHLKKTKTRQRSLAVEMGMTEGYMSLLLSGRRKWTMRLVSLFADKTGCRIVIN